MTDIEKTASALTSNKDDVVAPLQAAEAAAEIGFTNAPFAAIQRGSRVVHAAPIVDTSFPGGGSFRYPRLRAFCGVKHCWGEASGPATCKRCAATIKRLVAANAAPSEASQECDCCNLRCVCTTPESHHTEVDCGFAEPVHPAERSDPQGGGVDA